MVFADHSACTSLFKAPHPSAKLASGCYPVGNTVVLAVQAEVAEEDESAQTAVVSEVKQPQREHSECKAMLAYLEDGVLHEESALARKITLERPHFEVTDGCLYHENPPQTW